jgi:tetratricopeptide (TPR) repeat protein
MFLNKILNSSLLIIWLLILAVASVTLAQRKPVVNDPLLAFEKNIEIGKLDETEKPLLAFAFADPRNARAVELVGRLRFRQGRVDEALALYKRCLELDPKLASAKVTYATILYAAGRTDAAAQTLSDINEHELTTTGLLLDFARALSLVGHYQRSLAVVEKLPLNVQASDALPVRAICYAQLGDTVGFDASIAQAKRLVATKPTVAVRFVDILLTAGRRPQAVDLLRSLAAAFPKNARILVMLAKVQIGDKDHSQARLNLNRAGALDPRLPEIWSQSASLEAAEGRPHLALKFLEKALELGPDSTDALSLMVVVAMRANQPRKAVTAAEKLIKSDSHNPDFLYLHGIASLQNGNVEGARTSLESFLAARPKDSRGCLALGMTLAAQKDQIEAARRQLLRCTELDKANFEARYQLGLSYKIQGDAVRAIKFFEETIAIAPNYSLALRDLGTMYLQTGEEAKARSFLEQSVSLDASDADTHFQLSRLYNLTGEHERARKHLETFQKLKSPKANSTQK